MGTMVLSQQSPILIVLSFQLIEMVTKKMMNRSLKDKSKANAIAKNANLNVKTILNNTDLKAKMIAKNTYAKTTGYEVTNGEYVTDGESALQ